MSCSIFVPRWKKRSTLSAQSDENLRCSREPQPGERTRTILISSFCVHSLSRAVRSLRPEEEYVYQHASNCQADRNPRDPNGALTAFRTRASANFPKEADKEVLIMSKIQIQSPKGRFISNPATNATPSPRVISREEWLEVRTALLAKEKAFTKSLLKWAEFCLRP
jgi:hypothetical protein